MRCSANEACTDTVACVFNTTGPTPGSLPLSHYCSRTTQPTLLDTACRDQLRRGKPSIGRQSDQKSGQSGDWRRRRPSASVIRQQQPFLCGWTNEPQYRSHATHVLFKFLVIQSADGQGLRRARAQPVIARLPRQPAIHSPPNPAVQPKCIILQCRSGAVQAQASLTNLDSPSRRWIF